MDRFAVRVPPITGIFYYFYYYKIYHFVIYIFPFNKITHFLINFFEGWRLNYSKRAILMRPFFSAPNNFTQINLFNFLASVKKLGKKIRGGTYLDLCKLGRFFYLCKKFLGSEVRVLISVNFSFLGRFFYLCKKFLGSEVRVLISVN